MSTTLLKEITFQPLGLYNDGTNVYVAKDGGRINKIVIEGAVETVFAILNDKINAIASTSQDTNLYVGLASGELKQVVLATGVVSTLEIFDSAIISLSMYASALYIGLANGQIRFKDFSA